MLKELLKSLYKAKPELVEEHKRLVDTLRTGSKKEQLKEAGRQLKELKEMVEKEDRCWEGYKPTPGKKPYEKGSCEPVSKEDATAPDKKSSAGSWKIKIKREPGYHDVKDVLDMGSQQHNSYVLENGRTVSHDQVEDLDITGKKPQSLEKSKYGPKDMGLYNPADNVKRKEGRTGEVRENVGQNKAVQSYTSSAYGTASQQASRQATKDKKMSSKSRVKSMKDMSEDELAAIKARYTTKSDSMDEKISNLKAKAAVKPEKPMGQKIKEIKQKYADKPEPSDSDRVAAMKIKYAGLLKKTLTEAEIKNLATEVARRQPTSEEVMILLDYQNKVSQNLGSVSIGDREEEVGY